MAGQEGGGGKKGGNTCKMGELQKKRTKKKLQQNRGWRRGGHISVTVKTQEVTHEEATADFVKKYEEL